MRRLALLAVLGLAGCVTPSIPIPPPDPSMMHFDLTTDSNGAVTSVSLTYPATQSYENGVAYVYNRSLGVGVIQQISANGSIGPTPPVAARLNDQLVISVENDMQTVSTCVLLGNGIAAGYCP